VELNILFVEDDESNIEDFKNFCKEFIDDNKNVELEFTICKDEKETYQALTFNSFNAAIIDLNLNKDTEAGIRIIDKIHSNHRIPMIVFSGNANRTATKQYVLKSISKGKETYGVLIDELHKFNRTGIMNILGKTGHLEELIDKVFWENLHPKMSKFQEYAKDNDIEKDLLRYIINHFNEFLEDGVKYVFPEEMYICPPINPEITTGSIIENKESHQFYIVMSPSCDIQQGCDKFIVAKIIQIESLPEIIKKYEKVDEAEKKLKEYNDTTLEGDRKVKETNQLIGNVKSAKNNVLGLIKGFIDTPSNKFHFLYANKNFDNSIIDFHDLETIKKADISGYRKVMSITSPFLKDIQSRFASYYARQGSPDFDFSPIIEEYRSKLFSE
jgi:CheY-like chemotaxis protein